MALFGASGPPRGGATGCLARARARARAPRKSAPVFLRELNLRSTANGSARPPGAARQPPGVARQPRASKQASCQATAAPGAAYQRPSWPPRGPSYRPGRPRGRLVGPTRRPRGPPGSPVRGRGSRCGQERKPTSGTAGRHWAAMERRPHISPSPYLAPKRPARPNSSCFRKREDTTRKNAKHRCVNAHAAAYATLFQPQ